MTSPIGTFVEEVVRYLQQNFEIVFDFLTFFFEYAILNIENILLSIPKLLLIISLAIIVWLISNKYVGFFTMPGLLVIDFLGVWPEAMRTLALVSVALVVTLTIGILVGIFLAEFDYAEMATRPILDFLQTMPAYVYLVPAIIFFGMGVVSGAVATIMLSLPPVVRIVNLGIREVRIDLIEVGKSFGATRLQILRKIKIPQAVPSIRLAVNQAIMYCLGMVVIAAMIGCGGLGAVVVRAITRVRFGEGFEGGLAIVLLAIILDRATRHLDKIRTRRKNLEMEFTKQVRHIYSVWLMIKCRIRKRSQV